MLPFYPFFWADYSSKTFDLTQGQHGAYVLFMRHIYTTGQPVPDKQKFSIARALSEQEQENASLVLNQFFKRDGENWRQLRCEEIMEDQHKKHQARVKAGKLGGKQKSSNARAKLYQPESESESESKKESDSFKNEFSIERLLDDDAIAEARRAAPGWDLYPLYRQYDALVYSGQFERPKAPGKAFPAWLRKITKGKPPQ